MDSRVNFNWKAISSSVRSGLALVGPLGKLFLPVAVIAFVPTFLAGVISNKTLLLFITFTGIRRVTAWVADLFTFFWYVNMSRIAELEGEKRWSSAGGYVIFGTLASLFGGLVAMAVCMATARPLLRLLEVLYQQRLVTEI